MEEVLQTYARRASPGLATLGRGVLGNLAISASAPMIASADGAAGGPPPEPERAVILRGGPILTVDDANPVGEALAIRGSTIVGVGSLTEIKRHYTPGTEIVDLDGHAVLPGFVEPHVQVLRSALAAVDIDANDAAALFEEDPARVAELGTHMLRELAMRGCTTVYDTGIGLLAGSAEHELLRALARAPDAPLRVRGAFTPELAAALGAAPGGDDERYDVVGISYWVDGAIHDFAAALGEPYLNGAGSGRLEHEEGELREGMRAWHDAGWQLVVHANGDRAVEQALSCYEAILSGGAPSMAGGAPSMAGGGLCMAGGDPSAGGGDPSAASGDPRPRTHRIEHFTVVGDEQIAQAARLGLAVSHTINDIYYWGESFRDQVLGLERAAHMHSLRRDLEHGIESSCHSDSPASPVDPCLALRTATTRLMRDSDDVLGPFQQLKLDEALRTVTRSPARQVLLGDRVGSLRTGMLADLVVLDRDPRDVAPERLHELRVLETWLGGRRQRWA
jgi:predicted amidohydrolase YtcJ